MAKSGLFGSQLTGLLPQESLEKDGRQSKQMSEGMHTQTHTHKPWHLIEDPCIAKALYSPQLAPFSDVYPIPSTAEPSPCFCVGEPLVSFSFSSADMTFACVTHTLPWCGQKRTMRWTFKAKSHRSSSVFKKTVKTGLRSVRLAQHIKMQNLWQTETRRAAQVERL